MNAPSLSDMFKATQLTRAGRVAEATALLQRLLQGGSHAGDSSGVVAPDASALLPASPRRPELSHANDNPAPPPAESPRPGFMQRLKKGALASSIPAFARQRPTVPADPVPAGARFTTATFSNASGRRSYKVYIPATYDGQPVPLIVMLHGCTQSPDDFAAGTRMNVAAERHGCLVVYPEQASSANHAKCWNWFSPDDQHRDRGEPSLIAGITRTVMQEYAIDPSRVYVAGLSAGGAAAAIMGATYPDLYAAIGVHSGLACGAAADLPSAFGAMRQGAGVRARKATSVPTIVFHGDRDMTVHPVNGSEVIAQSMPDSGLRTEEHQSQVPGGRAYRRILHLDPRGSARYEQWVVHGAGHAWAGGSAAGTYTDPLGPDATREMLRFFLAHRQS
jgi:poly(hydroxyalkanoate) depolymerase family esterase